MTSGYSHDAAYDSGFIQVSDIHKLHYEQYGKQDGKAVIFLHGGPGGETSLSNTIYFDPDVYRVVLLDQRGCGKSKPPSELRENNSQNLVSDIESLRKYLRISKWHMVFGGSWGSTLALLYSQTHPEMVGSLVLRGIFAVRKSELKWNFGDFGAKAIFPDFYNEFRNYIPEEERDDLVKAYYSRLISDDRETRMFAAKAWSMYEMSTCQLIVNEENQKMCENEQWVMAHSAIEAHYFINGAFIEDGQLLRKENLDKIRHIPGGRKNNAIAEIY